jgi:hypothetical protein
MKKKYFKILFFSCVLIGFSVKSQINYTFAAVAGAYTANAAPTVLHSTSIDDATSASTAIGFTFQYGCTNYTTFQASSNGVMFLGTAAAGSDAFNDLNGSSDRPAIAPLWDDLKTGTAGNVNYKLTGVAGSRILTVEWKQMFWNYAGVTDCISFQVKLYETSNRIEFIYSQGAGAINSASASIGISGVTSGDFYSLSDATAAPTASKASETNTISAKPATGQIYRWDPVSCSGTPTAGTANANPATACASGTSALSLTGNTTGCGITYQWYSSPNNATWTLIAGATSSTYTPTVASSTYYDCKITCTNGGANATSSSVLVTVVGVPANDACASAISLGTVSTTTTTTGTNQCASADKTSSCHTPSRNVWYTFTVPAGGGSYSVSVNAGTMVDPCISVYSGTCAGLTNVNCTYGGSTSASVSANCLAAGTYYINVDDDAGTSGTFSLTVTQTTAGAGSANDVCASAVSLGTVSTTTTTTGTNYCASADKSSSCHSPTENVWYTFTVPAGGGSYVVSVNAGTMVDPCISVYSGTCAGLTNVNCTYGNSTNATVNANCLAAGTYYINVDDYFGTTGTFSLTVTQILAGASAPANDACAGAISLGSVSTTTTTTGNNLCATADKTSSCHAPTRNVWYTFTVPAGGGTYAVSVNAGTMVDPCITVYSGTCAGLTNVNCTYGSTSSASTNADCLAAGTYYINVDDDAGSAGTFSLTVTQTSAGSSAPANDNCASAISLGTVSTTTTTTGTNQCASADKTSTCHTPSRNVWYTFTVPAGGGSYAVSVTGGTIVSPCLTVYSGTCAGLTVKACTYGVSVNANCLAAGTYYINVDDDIGTAGTFSLTVTQTSAGTSVPNDACASAISLGTVSTATTTSGTNACATADKTSTCHTPSENVWYTFTVPAGGGSYNVSVLSGTMVDPCISVYSGTCAGLTNVNCTYGSGSSASVNASCLAAGTYYINVDDDAGSAGTFSLTVTQTISGAGPPANDDCTGAILLTSGASCTATVGNVTCATQTSPAGVCSGTPNDDIWYKFVAANTTEYINITASSSFDPVVQLFSGACNGTSIWCNDGSFITGASGSAAATGLTVGNTYLIRVFDYSSGAPSTATFSICITDPPTCPASLGTVVSVPSLPYAVLGATTCGKGDDITGVNVTSVCGSSNYYGGEDAVYTFTPTTTGVVTIIQSNTSGSVGFSLYSSCPFTGSCITQAQNSDASRTVCVTLTAGTVYYLVVDAYPTPNCYLYDLSISAPVVGTPAGKDCANSDPITSLPYSKTGIATCCMTNDYTSANACASVYMGGEDYVFSYTPGSNITIDITLSNTLPGTGLFITNGCPDVGTCVANNTSATGNPSLCGIVLTAGVTYYIIVDTDPSPSCTPFDISINQNNNATTCGLAYTASSITFSSADPLTTGTTLAFPDDHFATAYTPIGFNFCFDGIQYTQLLVSSNAYLIFDPIYCNTNLPGANATPSSYSAWSISGAIPNTTNAPRNAILGPWHDIDPGVAGNIRYTTYGTTPNQRFVVSYENVAMFSCNSILFSGQIKLFETTNAIEVHLTSKNLCSSWNSGQAILGLHNYNGTIAVVPAGGYNAPTQWTATNQAWQFSTSCQTCLTLLPVDVTSFTGKKYSESANQLEWKTSAEENVKDFVIERSMNGVSFQTIGVIHAKNILSGASYSFMDNIPDKAQTYYYRLISIDKNGDQKKSGLIVIEYKQYVFNAFSLYPNPATTSFILETEVNTPSKVKVIIYDVLGNIAGEQISELVNGFNTIEVSIENYKAGMYYVKVVSDDDTNKQLFIQKIVKQ